MEDVAIGKVCAELCSASFPVAQIQTGHVARVTSENGFELEGLDETSVSSFSSPSRPSSRFNTFKAHLLENLKYLANLHKFRFQGYVTPVQAGKDEITVIFTVFVPKWVVDDPSRLKPCTALAQLFLHLIPLTSQKGQMDGDGTTMYDLLQRDSGEGLEHPTLHDNNKQVDNAFSLRSCIMSLPGHGATIEFPKLSSYPTKIPQDAKVGTLLCLPEAVLYRIFGFLDTNSLRVMSSTCRFFHSIAAEVAPGLLLKLFPHQRAAIRWMRGREEYNESSTPTVPHPTIRKFVASNNTALWCNTATGQVQLHAPKPIHDFRGGLLCDEPGLGKTITALGLILQTKGKLPSAPPDHKVTWFKEHPRGGNKYGMYVVSEQGRSSSSKRRRRDFEHVDDGNMTNPPPKRQCSIMITVEDGTEEKGRIQQVKTPIQMPEQPRTFNEESSRDYGKDAEEEEEEEEEALPWLQCDLCQKWCRVPPGYRYPPNELWCCYQHPSPGWRSCLIGGDETEDDEEVTSCPGWIGVDQGLLPVEVAEENVDFFQTVLSKHQHVLYGGTKNYQQPKALLRWLLRQSPADLDPIFTVPRDVASSCPGFGHFLAELKFQPCKQRSKVHKTSAQQIGSIKSGPASQRPAGWTEGRLQRMDWLRWKRPEAYRLMQLDVESLARAVEKGLLPATFRIFLSPATLVVVPPELIPHWKSQIERHTRPGALRVAVYDSKSSGNSTLKEPPPHVLAWEYDVVITTFTKLSSDWNPSNPIGCSIITQIHWLRIILDEGHSIGSLGMTNKFAMALSLRADRRWVMTGTPAPSTMAAGTITLRYMQPLLSFLRDEALGPVSAFSEAIDKQLRDCPLASRWRLLSTLRRCMIRASKSDLWNLPPLRRRNVILPFSPSHAASYNSFVDLVRFNLLTSDWLDPEHKESLLAPPNASRATATLKNLQLSCNVSGNIVLQVSSDDVYECLDLVAGSSGLLPPNPVALGPPFCAKTTSHAHPLARVEQALCHGGTCTKCNAAVRLLFVTPCAHTVCVDCTSKDKFGCPCCSTPYLMQSCEDPARIADNPNPKWSVPQQLIEFQPAYAQRGARGAGEGSWQPDWQHTDSTKCQYLIKRLFEVEALRTGELNGNTRVTKAIVFSQFWPHLLLLERSLNMAVDNPLTQVAQYRSTRDDKYGKSLTQAEKAAELFRFWKDPRCGVLLMDESGALGLDLSFVQYVFLMEPIRDKSLEEQVVSRAHRMGATREVTVEIIAMKATYEEAMLRKFGDLGEAECTASQCQVNNGLDLLCRTSSKPSQSSTEAERRRQEAMRRSDRNAFLLGLKPVT